MRRAEWFEIYYRVLPTIDGYSYKKAWEATEAIVKRYKNYNSFKKAKTMYLRHGY
jgi:hypothetical protein